MRALEVIQIAQGAALLGAAGVLLSREIGDGSATESAVYGAMTGVALVSAQVASMQEDAPILANGWAMIALGAAAAGAAGGAGLSLVIDR